MGRCVMYPAPILKRGRDLDSYKPPPRKPPRRVRMLPIQRRYCRVLGSGGWCSISQGVSDRPDHIYQPHHPTLTLPALLTPPHHPPPAHSPSGLPDPRQLCTYTLQVMAAVAASTSMSRLSLILPGNRVIGLLANGALRLLDNQEAGPETPLN